jgi:DNA polymerase-3 subunit alpha
MSWINLHGHSEFSVGDGFGSPMEHAKRTKELELSALCFTEHGSLRGLPELHRACKAHDLLPITGVELYVSTDSRRRSLFPEQLASLRGDKDAIKRVEEEVGIRDRRHLCLVAYTEEGVRNIIALNNLGAIEGFHRVPRVSFDDLRAHSEGVFASSACLGGVLAKPFLRGQHHKTIEALEELVDIYGRRFSIEVQPHLPYHDWNQRALELSRSYDVPLLATNDSHYVLPEDASLHDTHLAISWRQAKDEERIAYQGGSYYLKTAEQVREELERSLPPEVCRQAIERGSEIHSEIKKGGGSRVYCPPIPKRDDSVRLRALCEEGLDELGLEPHLDRWYRGRMEFELEVIKAKGFDSYFILVSDVVRWAKSQGIIVGAGRGSAGGSLLCYLLGITMVDPIEHGLLFERFLTLDRNDPPDIDLDFEDARREEVFDYLRDKYPTCFKIGTFLFSKGKGSLKDVGRVYGVPFDQLNKLSSLVGEDLASSVSESTELSDLFNRVEGMKDALKIEGSLRSCGKHPAGVVLSDSAIDFLPLENRGGEIVSAYEMGAVEALGLIKLDVLGLRYLTIVGDALRFIRQTKPFFKLEDIPLDDPETLNGFTEKDVVGVFQFDSPSALDALDGVEVQTFDDIVQLTSLNRPSGRDSGGLATWKRRREEGGPLKLSEPLVEEVTEETSGVLIYQEQIMNLLKGIGFDATEVGSIRKMISKSKEAQMRQLRDQFIEKANSSGRVSDPEALWDLVVAFGRYGFNKSHAVCYSVLSYRTMYLKRHFPSQFFTALIKSSEREKSASFASLASLRGIKVEPPTVNSREGDWSFLAPIKKEDSESILAGVSQIKGVGDTASTEIALHAPFKSLGDFLRRVNRRVVNKGVLKALASAGAFRDFTSSTQGLLDRLDDIVKASTRKSSEEMIETILGELPPDDELVRALKLSEVGVFFGDPSMSRVLQDHVADLLGPQLTSLGAFALGKLALGVVTYTKTGSSSSRNWAKLQIRSLFAEDEITVSLNDEAYLFNREAIDGGTGSLVLVRCDKRSDGKPTASELVLVSSLSESYLSKPLPSAKNTFILVHKVKRTTRAGKRMIVALLVNRDGGREFLDFDGWMKHPIGSVLKVKSKKMGESGRLVTSSERVGS